MEPDRRTGEDGLAPEEEPVTTGTLFLTFLLLVVIGGVWVIVYRLLMTR